jgi:hypothetical protein
VKARVIQLSDTRDLPASFDNVGKYPALRENCQEHFLLIFFLASAWLSFLRKPRDFVAMNVPSASGFLGFYLFAMYVTTNRFRRQLENLSGLFVMDIILIND